MWQTWYYGVGGISMTGGWVTGILELKKWME